MLSFDSSIQKATDLKTRPSTVNLVEQYKCTPDNMWRMNFQWPLLFHPLQNILRRLRMYTSSPWAPFRGQFRKKKIDSFYFYLFFSGLFCFILFKKNFEGVNNVDGVPLGIFFGAISIF